MLTLPRSARIACWLNGWISGRVAADLAITGIAGPDEEPLTVVGLPGEPVDAAALLLAAVRRLGVVRVSVALPVPGDLLGLGGPGVFNVDALDAGEAMVWQGAGVGLVPQHRFSWVAQEATPPVYLPDVSTADSELRGVVLEAAQALAALDVASWSPDAADAVLNLRRPADPDEPTAFASGRAARLVTVGLRCLEIVRLALRDDGGAATSLEAARRREALLPMRHCASAAVVAGCSSVDGR